MEGEGRAGDGRATALWQGCKGRAWAWAWSALLALGGSPRREVHREVRKIATVSPELLAASPPAQG